MTFEKLTSRYLLSILILKKHLKGIVSLVKYSNKVSPGEPFSDAKTVDKISRVIAQPPWFSNPNAPSSSPTWFWRSEWCTLLQTFCKSSVKVAAPGGSESNLTPWFRNVGTCILTPPKSRTANPLIWPVRRQTRATRFCPCPSRPIPYWTNGGSTSSNRTVTYLLDKEINICSDPFLLTDHSTDLWNHSFFWEIISNLYRISAYVRPSPLGFWANAAAMIRVSSFSRALVSRLSRRIQERWRASLKSSWLPVTPATSRKPQRSFGSNFSRSSDWTGPLQVVPRRDSSQGGSYLTS